MRSCFVLQALCLALVHLSCSEACRVGSEVLKLYARKSIERILDARRLQAVYWPDEPLNAKALSRVTGINITLAETQFSLESAGRKSAASPTAATKEPAAKLIEDIFVSCSADRDRSYSLTINLELNNPFKAIDFKFSQAENELEPGLQTSGLFRIQLPQSTFLVQLNQRIRYDECLDVKYVQLGPNVNYDVECLDCSDSQRAHLERIFSKKMSQFDAELDSILSEKLLLGLQLLLNQRRLDLDLYLEPQQ